MKKLLTMVAILIMAVGTVFISCKKDQSIGSSDALATEASANSSKTAQSIMLAVDAPQDIVVENHQIWKFDQLAAAIANYGYNSCTTNQCRNQAKANAQQNRCTYWAQEGHPFWTMTSETGTSGDVTTTITGKILGESFLLGGAFKVKGKYSFTLKEEDGISRVTNLMCSVDGGTPFPISHTIVDASSSNNCLLDFVYTANNGPYGNPAVYSYLKDGTLGSILTSDDAIPNDAGCGTVSYAQITPFDLVLATGSHTVTITATVKGNDGISTINVSQVSTVHITADNCAN